jgi:hypothetical protein
MEHARGVTQAQHVGGAPATRPDKDTDVHMGAVAVDRQTAESPLLWHLQEECAKCVQAGGWGGVGAITGAVAALTKGKGKGKGAVRKGAGWGAGAGHKGETPKGSGKKNETFDGYCHYCNGFGHRKSQCKLLD